MPGNLREYREELYRLRTHPNEREFVDERDSFVKVYFSLVPFLVMEYVAERSYEFLPGGVIFPVGFLLFWAYFYTFYKPGFLEERLSDPRKWDITGIVSTLFGVMIWFVKVTVVELSHVLLLRWIVAPAPKARKAERPKAQARSENTHGGFHETRSQGTNTSSGPHTTGTPPPSHLPTDIRHALTVLGLSEKVTWREIHKRYRELAKKFHPDLNRDITEIGRRFMMVDAAYKKLSSVRTKYFLDKNENE